jgi:hypothetical protein
MKKLILLILTFACTFCNAQINLVPNPSFEDTVGCPIGGLVVDYAVGWHSYKLTPDYFNNCNSTVVGVPSNYMGFQHARTGVAYAGFITISFGSMNNKEIIGAQLNQQMQVGQTYYVSFYVNRAYNPATFYNYNNLATNKIGVRFSTISYPNFWTEPIPINDTAHVYTNTIITDTVNWVKISGTFTADSAYNYIAIGNFYTDSHTSIIQLDSIATLAYYYIDDICVSTDSNYCNSISGITNIDFKNPMKIFPNPLQSELNIESIGFTDIEIYDDIGKLVFEKKFIDAIYRTKIQLPNLCKGLYVVKIKTLMSYYTKKIIHN